MESPGAEQFLEGGNMAGPVQRIGSTVRRHTGPWTPAVHDLLRHLEREGFRGAPRALGIDEDGREILTFIPGSLAYPRVLDDPELQRVARLIHEYHTAAATFRVSPDATWHPNGRDPNAACEVVCHNDLAPWNLITGDQEWAFIDWDLAAPGRRLWDLALAVCAFVPLYPDSTRQVERTRLFCEAYGMAPDEQRELRAVLVQRMRRMWQVLLDNSDREPYASLVSDGHADFWMRVEEHVSSLDFA